nr:unnamed protein product [Spirometra erinaceieuropaei]
MTEYHGPCATMMNMTDLLSLIQFVSLPACSSYFSIYPSSLSPSSPSSSCSSAIPAAVIIILFSSSPSRHFLCHPAFSTHLILLSPVFYHLLPLDLV